MTIGLLETLFVYFFLPFLKGGSSDFCGSKDLKKVLLHKFLGSISLQTTSNLVLLL